MAGGLPKLSVDISVVCSSYVCRVAEEAHHLPTRLVLPVLCQCFDSKIVFVLCHKFVSLADSAATSPPLDEREPYGRII